MSYREFPPATPLATSIECFWVSTEQAGLGTPRHHRVLPDGCMDLLFDLTPSSALRSSVVGTMTQALNFTTTGPVDLLGIRFRPGGLSGFLAMDAAELTDDRVDLANFWGKLADETWHKLGETTPAHRISLLQEILSGRLKPLTMDPFVRHCVTRIETAQGDLRIIDLEKGTGLSSRQIERKFAQHLGIAPKTFARIVRFKAVMSAATQAHSPSWANLACAFGFADQPHLVREFKTFSGLSPAEYSHGN